MSEQIENWQHHVKNVYSQNGEDGILEEIFRRIGTENKWCFEVGAADGLWFSNTRKLVEEGWNAVLIEADDDKYEKLRKSYIEWEENAVKIVHRKIEPAGENSIDEILGAIEVIGTPDLGVIDIDGDDYYVFLNLIKFQPRVLIVEFDPNAPDSFFVPPMGSGKGAGIKAIISVGLAKHYTVLAEIGTNVIFVKNELIPKIFGEKSPSEPDPLADKHCYLNIGAGESHLHGYIPIDRKNGDEAFPLTWGGKVIADASVDVAIASHILEHFGGREAQEVLKEWVRVLKPGGVLKIAVPDMDKIMDAVAAGNPNAWPIQGYIYGGQTDENDYHKSGWNEEWLRHSMQLAGLVDIKPWVSEIADCASLPISLNLMGTKPVDVPAITKPFPSHRKFAAVMSMPRLCFSDNMYCALQTFVPFRIPFEKATGAWWDDCLDRVITPHLTDGSDYVITIDYDTVFRPEHVHQMCVLMEEHPEADAICPIQFKRAEPNYLFRVIDTKTGEYRTGTMGIDELEKPLTEIGWGHFGLTIFRVSALRKLPRPWFVSKPAPDGTRGDGRTDADISFWEQFRASGNKLFLANHVGVGHLELMASLPDQNLTRFHVHAEDLMKTWPANARR